MPSLLLITLSDPSTDRRMQSFVRFFREEGWEVNVLAASAGGASSASGPRRFLSYDRRAKRAVRSRRADIVLACDVFSLGAAVTMKLHGNARRVIYDAREVYSELPTVSHRPLVKWAWKRYERRYIDEVDLMLVTAPHDVDAIRRVHDGVPRTALVRNLPWLRELHRDRSRLARFGLDLTRPTLVYVGGLQKGRGLHLLVRAMRAVKANLLVIGSGVIETELRQLVEGEQLSDRVVLAGALPSDEALDVVAACDAGLSLIEPISESYALALPSKIFEYMMAGLPVLSSRLVHVEELFAKEPWIHFTDVTSSSAIEAGLRELLDIIGQPQLEEREKELARTQYNFGADAQHAFRDILRAWQVTG